MIGRETLELDAVVPQEERTIGVIGVGPGVGVTMICRLLEKEQAGKGEKARILDMGKVSPGEILSKKMDRLLVVADGREELPEGLEMLLGRLNEKDSRVGVVLNRWSPSPSPAATPQYQGLPVFRVPELLPEELKGLYNFVFYN